MKYLIFFNVCCWLIACLLTSGCQKEYHEQKHVTHIKVEKVVDWQIPPTNLDPEELKEMDEFEESKLDNDPIDMEILYTRLTI